MLPIVNLGTVSLQGLSIDCKRFHFCGRLILRFSVCHFSGTVYMYFASYYFHEFNIRLWDNSLNKYFYLILNDKVVTSGHNKKMKTSQKKEIVQYFSNGIFEGKPPQYAKF